MKHDIFDNPHAFGPLVESLAWREDKYPRLSGTFEGVVLHGAPDSQHAGNPLGDIVADPWVVRVDLKTALISQVAVGDTLTRCGVSGDVLTVQAISRDDTGWLLICSSNQRSPL